MGSSISVLDFASIGSALSVRSFACVGSSVSIIGCRVFTQSHLSVCDFLHLGASLAVRAMVRLGSSLAVSQTVNTASNTNLRRLQSDHASHGMLSVSGSASFAGSLAVAGHLCASALSVHSSGKFEQLQIVKLETGRVSVSGASRLGAIDVDRGLKLGGDLCVGRKLFLDSEQRSLIRGSGDSISLSVDSDRKMSASASGGSLHGQWSVESAVTTSDRRLKTDIEPLMRTLARVRPTQEREVPIETTVGWVLRELRPVSFHLKKGSEAKHLKFGFVAQEMEQTLPSLVRVDQHHSGTKSVAYQDLIAVLTLVAQLQQDGLAQMQRSVAQMSAVSQEAAASNQAGVSRVEDAVSLLTAELRASRSGAASNATDEVARLAAAVTQLERQVDEDRQTWRKDAVGLKGSTPEQLSRIADLETANAELVELLHAASSRIEELEHLVARLSGQA